MTHDYRYGRPSIQRIYFGPCLDESSEDDKRYAILVAIRRPHKFMGCRHHGKYVGYQYHNGYRGD